MGVREKHVKAVIQLRRATEQQWIDKDPILRVGEPALSIDINKLKIGNGVDKWSDIEYLSANYEAGTGIIIENDTIGLDELLFDCGTSTTSIGG